MTAPAARTAIHPAERREQRKERVIRAGPLACVPIRANARPIVQLRAFVSGPAEGESRQDGRASQDVFRCSVSLQNRELTYSSLTGQACLAPLRSLHGDGASLRPLRRNGSSRNSRREGMAPRTTLPIRREPLSGEGQIFSSGRFGGWSVGQGCRLDLALQRHSLLFSSSSPHLRAPPGTLLCDCIFLLLLSRHPTKEPLS
ncbi:hypothetical protein BJY59DRAFT_266897 [Rhodotorula toruloides]